MKCVSCNTKFPTKHIARCSRLDKNICLQCAIRGAGSHSCDLSCPDAKFPRINTYPLSSGVAGFGSTGEQRTTTEEFIPRAFHFIACDVISINYKLSSLFLIEVDIRFKLTGNQNLLDNIYRDEYWKTIPVQDVIKESVSLIKELVAPTFAIFLDGGLRVMPDSVTLDIDDAENPILLNQTPEFIGLPDCYPPLTKEEKPLDKKYSYFHGKCSVFYTPFRLDKTYHLQFSLEAINFFYVTGLLFPFRFVNMSSWSIKAESPVVIAQRLLRVVDPIKEDVFPPKQQYNWDRKTSLELKPPWMSYADPFREQPLVGNYLPGKVIDEEGKENLSLKNYSVIATRIFFGLPGASDLIANVQTTTSPIPVRIYEQLQKLPRYRDFLISYDLLNTTKEPLELELVAEIQGYTYEAIDNITLPPHGGGKSARVIHTQCPKLKRGLVEKITSAETATLVYKIFKKVKGKRILIERNTREIKFLPCDMIIWAIKDPKGSSYYDLARMLGAWITPTDSKRLLDKVRGGAASLHPDKALAGQQGDTTLDEITSQVKALYDYINQKLKIKYVNQPFTYDFGSNGQRVLTPENVLTAKAGNCIDLVVLFTSLMEGMGLDPLIMLTSNHAFLGWGNKYKTEEMGFLECTVLGAVNPKNGQAITFEEAYEKAKDTFKKEFIKIGVTDYLPLHSIILNPDEPQIIDLSDIRKEGIFRL